MPITIPLLDHAQSTHIKSLDPEKVKVYLKDLLEWRVIIGVSQDIEDLFLEGQYDDSLTCHLVQGRIIDATKEDVQGLTVFAMSGQVEHYEDVTKLSKYYDYKVIVEATKHKTNGLQNANESPAAPLRPENGGEL